MQRIGENTYIDDTLVTCAEYQLFIDEMREQGKYYQPDHWTSCQFPHGQAHEPILGMRQTDAADFCVWLTHRKSQKWKFRLPFQQEAITFPIKLIEVDPLGYWLMTNNQFIWATSMFMNTRAIDLNLTKRFAEDLYNMVNKNYTNSLAFAYALKQDNTFGGVFKAFSNIRNHNNILDRTLHIARNVLAADLTELERFNVIFEVGQFLNLIRLKIFDITSSSSVSDKIYAFVNEIKRIPNNHNLVKRILFKFLLGARNISFEQAQDQMLKLILDIHFDFFTLQERIAGRSPAFEGIRLVKERIR